MVEQENQENTNQDVNCIYIDKFCEFICKADLLRKICDHWERVASIIELGGTEKAELKTLSDGRKFDKLVHQLFRMWLAKEEKTSGSLTLNKISDVFSQLGIEVVRITLEGQYDSLNTKLYISLPQEPPVAGTNPDVNCICIAKFCEFICKADVSREICDYWERVACLVQLGGTDKAKLQYLKDRTQLDELVHKLFQMWLNKEEGRREPLTLQKIVLVFSEMGIHTMQTTLEWKYGSLDMKLYIPLPQDPPVAGEGASSGNENTPEPSAQQVEENLASTKDKKAQKDKKGFKLIPFRKSVKVKADMAGIKTELMVGDTEKEEEEIAYLSYDDIKDLSHTQTMALQALLDPILKIDTSLQVRQFLCKSVYSIGTYVPEVDGWIAKVALMAMEMFSIIRYFIDAGVPIRKDKFEAVVRRFVVDPGLAPDLITSMVTSGMFVPKEGDKKSLLLTEPSVKDAIIVIQRCDAFLKCLETPFPNEGKVQEKMLLAVVAAVEEHKDPAEQKSMGKKLSPHISYLVREIVWPRKHPGFKNVQRKIPKVIRFCTESVIVVAKQRYESLASLSDEDLEVFEKAYKKAQEEKLDIGALAAGVGIGMGAAALTMGAVSMIDD
jgi:hypothetical protein